MMFINIRAEVPTIDAKKFAAKMDSELEKLFVEAARAFLIAATRRIPVRTGFLRGAFSRLEDVVGAFEFTARKPSPQPTKNKGRKIGTRPGRDAASIAIRLVKARQRQIGLLDEIRELRSLEKTRALGLATKRILTDKAARIQLRDAEEQASKAAQRGIALQQRRQRRSFIRQAKINADKIEQLVTQLKKQYNIKLSKRLGDSSRNAQLALEKLQERRERNFFRVLKNLNRAHFGFVTTTRVIPMAGGVRRIRVKSTMSTEEYKKRVTQLREKFKGQSPGMRRINSRLNKLRLDQVKRIGKNLQNYRKRLVNKVREEFKEALKKANGREQKELNKAISRKIKAALLAKVRKESERATAGHPLLALASHRKQLTDLRINTLQQALAGNEEERLNLVARVSGRGGTRIAGQTQAGKFDIRPGERVLKTFKLVEFYYPIKGSKAGRIQKTPRSGRIFATAPTKIITKTKGGFQPNNQAFTQLASFLKASGKAIPKSVTAAGREFANVPTEYVFNFGVNIRYLQINETRQAWFAWQAGIRAFQQHLNGNALKRIPKLQEFLNTEVHTLNGNQKSVTVSRR